MMMVKQLHLYTSLFIDMSAIIWIQWSDDHSVHTPRLEVKGPAPYAIHDFPGTIARKYDMGDHVKKLLYDILMWNQFCLIIDWIVNIACNLFNMYNLYVFLFWNVQQFNKFNKLFVDSLTVILYALITLEKL